MKFLMIASHLPAALNFRGKLLEAIAQKGFSIHILAPDLALFPDDHNTLASLGYFVHDLPMQRTGTNPVADIQTLLITYRLLDKIKPDYMLAFTIKPVIYGTLAAWLAKVPNRFALITGLGYAFQQVEETSQRSMFQKMVHGLYQRALSKAHKVFFQNPDDLNLFNQLNLIQPDSLTVVVNGSGVSISEFEVKPFPVDAVGEIIPSFLMIARFLKDKGVVEYVEAAKLIKQQYPNAQFHLVGWIDENPAAINQQQLDTWIAEGNINYWGKLKDVRPAIAASSIYVLPSYREGTPRTVLEAMAMGRPIITTDAPGCRETVVDGVNGYLVPVKSVDELAAAMESFILDLELVTKMGTASRQLAEEKFDVHAVNRVMLTEMDIL